MALDGTFSGLKASIADFLNRADLTATIPDFITIAEAQMARRFVSRIKQGKDVPRRLIIRSDAVFALADEYVAVPADFYGPLEMMLSATPPIELAYIEPSNLQREKKLARWTGAPKYYTVVGGQFQIYPAADQAYTVELTYIARLPALTAGNQASNWILQAHPDAYLYGALMQSAPYMHEDARVNVWGQMFTSAVDDICESDPMPTDKMTLRTDIHVPRRNSGSYNISTDA